MERLEPRPVTETARGILEDPPQAILCFDNYRGNSPDARAIASLIMMQRAITALIVSHSKKLYPKENRPKIACFAGEHKKGLVSGSALMKRTLMALGAEESEIETRSTTVSTTTDITQFHSYIKENNITGPVAIVTSDDHIERTEQEIVNHFQKHKHGPIPKIYVLSLHSEEIASLPLPTEVRKSLFYLGNFSALVKAEREGSLSGGRTEKIATRISKIKHQHRRETVQAVAEFVNHLHTPEALRRIRRVNRQFRRGHKNLYVKRKDRNPKIRAFPDMPAHG